MITLEDMLIILGAETPFDKDGKLTPEGDKARVKLVKIAQGLEDIEVMKPVHHNIEDYLDEVMND